MEPRNKNHACGHHISACTRMHTHETCFVHGLASWRHPEASESPGQGPEVNGRNSALIHVKKTCSLHRNMQATQGADRPCLYARVSRTSITKQVHTAKLFLTCKPRNPRARTPHRTPYRGPRGWNTHYKGEPSPRGFFGKSRLVNLQDVNIISGDGAFWPPLSTLYCKVFWVFLSRPRCRYCLHTFTALRLQVSCMHDPSGRWMAEKCFLKRPRRALSLQVPTASGGGSLMPWLLLLQLAEALISTSEPQKPNH